LLRGLAVVGAQVPLAPLVQAARDEADRTAQVAFALYLGSRGITWSLDSLVATLKGTSSDLHVVSVLLWVLGALDALGEQAVLQALEVAQGSEDPGLRMAVVWAVGVLKGLEYERRRVQPNSHRGPSNARRWRMRVRTYLLERARPLVERLPATLLLRALGDKDAKIRAFAADTLAHLAAADLLSDTFPVDALVHALDDDEPRVRIGALYALGCLGERMPVQPVVRRLYDGKPQVRAAAANALGQLGAYAPVESLKEALADDDASVRRSVLHALRQVGSHVPGEELLAYLRDSDAGVRREAIAILVQLGSYILPRTIVTALSDSDPDLRWAAVKVLAAAGSAAPIEPLQVAQGDKSPYVRSAATEALILRGVVTDSPVDVQEPYTNGASAARLLPPSKERGDVRSVQQLVADLDDPDAEVRRLAAEALGNRDDARATEALVIALKDEDEHVRLAAILSLGEIAEIVESTPVDPIVRALGDSSADVIAGALKVLSKVDPSALVAAVPEATAILMGQGCGDILGSRVHAFIATTVGDMAKVPSALLDAVILLLDWPYWQVKVSAIRALAKLGQELPDTTIHRIMELTVDPEAQVIRTAADEALVQLVLDESIAERA
jgi:HEAT repeat protein